MAYRVKARCVGRSEQEERVEAAEGPMMVYKRVFEFRDSFGRVTRHEMSVPRTPNDLDENFEVGREYYLDFCKVIAERGSRKSSAEASTLDSGFLVE